MFLKFLQKILLAAVSCSLVLPAALPLLAAPQTDIQKSYQLSSPIVYTLPHKTVLALPFEQTLPTATIAEPLQYKLEPVFSTQQDKHTLEILLSNIESSQKEELEKALQACNAQLAANIPNQLTWKFTGDNELKLNITLPDRVSANITTVKSKRVINEALATITYKTYLVLTLTPDAVICPPLIVLDAGHGGNASGAVSNFLFEKDLNLDIALLADNLLRQDGYDVYLTRTTDENIALLARADAANILAADVFVSIHNNAVPEDMPGEIRKIYRGTTVLFNSAARQPAKDLALMMCDELSATLRTHQYPLQDRPGLVVLNSTWVPAVLAEVAMMPNAQDAKMIANHVYRQQAAAAIVRSTENYLAARHAVNATPQAAAPTSGRPNNSSPSASSLLTDTPSSNAANAANNGLAVICGEQIFYLDRIGDIYAGSAEKIFTANLAGLPLSSPPTALVEDEAWNLTAANGWLYYSNWSDNHRLYKIRPDGSEKTCLSDDAVADINITSTGDIVYTRWTNTGSNSDNSIYKIAADGSGKLQLNNDQSAYTAVVGDYVYYANASDHYKPYRIRLNGSERTKLSDDEVLFMAVADNTIYYSNHSDGDSLYKMHTDGSGRCQLNSDRTGFINFAAGYVYYTNASKQDSLCRIRPDGSQKQQLSNLNIGPMPINIVGSLIYYNHLFLHY